MTDEEKLTAVTKKLTGEKFYVGQRVRFNSCGDTDHVLGFTAFNGYVSTVVRVHEEAQSLVVDPDPSEIQGVPWPYEWWEPVYD